MNPVEPRRSVANVKMWLIRNYLHDLTEFYAGDEGRFSRMVVDQGKSLQTAHPAGWTQHIVNLTTTEAVEFYRVELARIYMQLIERNLLTEAPAELQDDLSGCQSTNHDHSTCYGVLWQCSECGKTVCCNEGADDGTQLCDTCWAKKEEHS